MNRLLKLLLLPLVFSGSALCAPGQDPAAVAPRGAWVIEIKPLPSPSDKPAALPARHPVRIESASDGTRKRDIVFYADGSKEEFWFVNGLAFSLAQDGKTATVINFSNARNGENEAGASPGFPGLWWIKSTSPAQTIKRDKLELRQYVRESVPVGTPQIHSVTEAMVDAKTGLPVEATTPVATHHYTHLSPPPGDLFMPPVFREAAEKALRRESRRKALAEAFAKQKPNPSGTPGR